MPRLSSRVSVRRATVAAVAAADNQESETTSVAEGDSLSVPTEEPKDKGSRVEVVVGGGTGGDADNGAFSDKSITGSAPSFQLPEPDNTLDIELLREEVGAGVGIKAVRGVRGLDEVAALIASGATRVGTATLDVFVDSPG